MDRSQNRLKKVQQLVEAAGGQARFAELVGISPSQAWQIAGSSPVRGIGSKMAARIEQAFSKPAGWLDWPGDAPPFSAAPLAASDAAAGAGRRVPVINYVQAGQLTEVGAHFCGEALEYLLTDIPLSERAFGLEIRGLSMAPQFVPGDKIIIDQEVAPKPGSFVVAMNGGEEATFKKYRPRGLDANGNDVFELVPLNEDFPSFFSDRQELVIIGTMVEHRRYYR
ncbi:LexA family protein [Achromobacter deleyi]|uniref:LexA family protein n=1 Tax=Achromobacter deleyi TaxID=1353891 RepID=UPI001468BC42|nr:S24 family peptidase [Achromobacter deleyi]CAB3870684.1 LexA repressor [Achromobacter deleyi]